MRREPYIGTGTEGSSPQNSENITNLYTEEEGKEPWKAGGLFVIEAKHKSTEVNKPPLGWGEQQWEGVSSWGSIVG